MNEGYSVSRRQLLAGLAGGFGSLAASALLAQEAAPPALDPLAPRTPHFTPRAKRCLFLFMQGGPSQVDTFDPKPALAEFAGRTMPVAQPRSRFSNRIAMPSHFAFRQHGQSGLPVSELFPHVARHVDKLCILRSLHCDNVEHAQALLQTFTGEQFFPRPSIGSWLLYGLGTENAALPGFVVLGQPAFASNTFYSSSFLPAAYQGTMIQSGNAPLPNLRNSQYSTDEQRRQLALLRDLNSVHQRGREDDSRLEARIQAFERAFRMQVQAPEAFDLAGETEATRRLYGIGGGLTDAYGRKLLLARRLLERDVRFVVAVSDKPEGAQAAWDGHSDLPGTHAICARAVDQPIAGLLHDLASRGLLEDTLVLWGGEFGRTPNPEGNDITRPNVGRGHHPFGYSMWLAGAGVKSGFAYGATDDFGCHAVEHRMHLHDLHATLLHLLGLDHERLTYRYGGRDFRLTDVHGRVHSEIFA